MPGPPRGLTFTSQRQSNHRRSLQGWSCAQSWACPARQAFVPPQGGAGNSGGTSLGKGDDAAGAE